MALKPGQLKCIQTLDKPIVVAAGAGSGKTFTLTKRIAGALESGFVDDIGQVCAITFTNKAAAELKSRVKAELRACGRPDQALKVDDAWISTIHGMCARILRSHAVELGLDPAFTVADAARIGEIADAAVNEVLLRAEAECSGVDGPGDLDVLFREYAAQSQGLGSSVRDMVQALMDRAAAHPRGADAFVVPAPGFGAAPLLEAALDAYRQLLDAAEREKPGSRRDAWLAATEEAWGVAASRVESGRVEDAEQALRLLAGLSHTKGFGSKTFKQLADECAVTIDSCMMELRLMAANPCLRTLVRLAREALLLFTAAKRREGLLDNNDLLVLAARAVEDHPDIAARYTDKFRLVMVDEFQDTDQMQVDMIKRLAGPGAVRLCTVGDAQQSIYRFRGADVSVYRRHLESVRSADADGIILLPDNFRSHADVLSLVDRVFERDDMFGGEFMSLAPGRDEGQVKHPFPAGEPRVRVQLATRAFKNGVPAEELVKHQARRVAETFAQLVRDGRRPGEMAVLLGRMSHADAFAAALREQGLACVISGGSVFANSVEAQQVLETARAVANPHDTEALYAVLSGPMFQLPDDDLLFLGTAQDPADGLPRRRALDAGMRALLDAESGAASGTQSVGGVSASLDAAVRVLGSAWRDAVRTPLSRVLMRTVLESGWISRLEAGGAEGLASAANVYKAIRMVEGLESQGAGGPITTLRAFEAQLECCKEAPGALSSKGGDFVRIMTVHASKGLEFPIVAVAEFRDPAAGVPKLLALGDGDRIYLSLDLGRTLDDIGGSAKSVKASAVYEDLTRDFADEDSLLQLARNAGSPLEQRAAMYGHGKLGDAEEAKRLLYVALTRAKEALVVCMAGTRTNNNPNGMPKNCMAAVVRALTHDDVGFDAGVSRFGFGGSADAVVEHDALVCEDAEAPAQVEAPAQAGQAAEARGGGFMVPAAQPRVPVAHIPLPAPHQGIFSYSSVAGACHGGDLLHTLAARFAVSCDAAGAQIEDLPGHGAHDAQPTKRPGSKGLVEAGREDGDMLEPDAPRFADADKATDFGTAFHRLAQMAVLARHAGPFQGALAQPPDGRIQAMMATCGLEDAHAARLMAALHRWFGSDEARRMAAYSHLQAEVPFMVPITSGLDTLDGHPGGPVFLEGEIDLLAWDDAHTEAQVVDYKTGGHADEDESTLRCKHVLQAACYAYALLLQGARTVEASFVRVERSRAGDAGQPQCVRYRFAADDAPALEAAIARAYAMAQ